MRSNQRQVSTKLKFILLIMRRQIEKDGKDDLSTFKEQMELSFTNEQSVLQSQVSFLNLENSSLNYYSINSKVIYLTLRTTKFTENTFRY